MIEYKGDGIPVRPETEVFCIFACGLETIKLKAKCFHWNWLYEGDRPNPSNIVSYKIIQ